MANKKRQRRLGGAGGDESRPNDAAKNAPVRTKTTGRRANARARKVALPIDTSLEDCSPDRSAHADILLEWDGERFTDPQSLTTLLAKSTDSARTAFGLAQSAVLYEWIARPIVKFQGGRVMVTAVVTRTRIRDVPDSKVCAAIYISGKNRIDLVQKSSADHEVLAKEICSRLLTELDSLDKATLIPQLNAICRKAQLRLVDPLDRLRPSETVKKLIESPPPLLEREFARIVALFPDALALIGIEPEQKLRIPSQIEVAHGKIVRFPKDYAAHSPRAALEFVLSCQTAGACLESICVDKLIEADINALRTIENDRQLIDRALRIVRMIIKRSSKLQVSHDHQTSPSRQFPAIRSLKKWQGELTAVAREFRLRGLEVPVNWDKTVRMGQVEIQSEAGSTDTLRRLEVHLQFSAEQLKKQNGRGGRPPNYLVDRLVALFFIGTRKAPTVSSRRDDTVVNPIIDFIEFVSRLVEDRSVTRGSIRTQVYEARKRARNERLPEKN